MAGETCGDIEQKGRHTLLGALRARRRAAVILLHLFAHRSYQLALKIHQPLPVEGQSAEAHYANAAGLQRPYRVSVAPALDRLETKNLAWQVKSDYAFAIRTDGLAHFERPGLDRVDSAATMARTHQQLTGTDRMCACDGAIQQLGAGVIQAEHLAQTVEPAVVARYLGSAAGEPCSSVGTGIVGDDSHCAVQGSVAMYSATASISSSVILDAIICMTLPTSLLRAPDLNACICFTT